MPNHYNAGPDNPNYGKVAWNRGIVATPECRAKISESLIGNQRRRGILHSAETRAKFGRKGATSKNWKGGRVQLKDGYWMIWSPGHPRARNGRYVYEHILIAEKALGRYLVFGKELVHHINGDPSDNRNCNLLICPKGYHYWLHARMAQLYQREHFGRSTDLPGNTPPEAVKDDR